MKAAPAAALLIWKYPPVEFAAASFVAEAFADIPAATVLLAGVVRIGVGKLNIAEKSCVAAVATA
ncbi:hypothetical protein [uncultured Devosia sp.]|nr:hypothetical protein [uncultured Devosia sp.]